MSRLSKAIIVGLFVGALGVIASLSPIGFDLEENIGLDLLFRLRGLKEPPSDVIIVSLDRVTADNLKLPSEPEKWPRFFHANLIENLAKQGAAVIAFDMIFSKPGLKEHDDLFAKAISNAGNVVLCEYIEKKTVLLSDNEGMHTGEATIERLIPPIPPFARSALALAPFPLPKVPVKVSQYWTFKAEAGDLPTLPVVVLQIFAYEVYDEFIHLLEKVRPIQVEKLLHDKDTIIQNRWVEENMQILRDHFRENPSIGDKMIEEIQNSSSLSFDSKKKRILQSLIKIYQGPKSRYLNFYGPPGTIKTVPYCQLLQHHEKSAAKQRQLDLKAKAVFVGLSERLRPEQKDGFYTVYSQPSGLDISGVEIAATAFANLLEDMPVRRLHNRNELALILFWGLVLGLLCRFLSTSISALCVIGLGALYLVTALYQFKNTGSWYPLVLPLFVQVPLAFFGSVLWKYSETNRDRQRIRDALGYYLPAKVLDQLSKNIGDLRADRKVVYGTCLFTDAGRYTTLSETMDPKKLSDFMDQYYQTLFKPVKNYGGIVINVVGDSMLALWATSDLDIPSKRRACFAALNIARAVHHFNRSYDNLQLPTRIGLHSGQILLGNIGAIDHYEYRPTGDIVNTASRMEGLNKYLGTEILVSQEVMGELDGFLARGLGKFLLAGKTKPTMIYELICCTEESNEQQRGLCAIFAEGFKAYRQQSWDEAIRVFQEAIRIYKNDGPSIFYLNECEKYRESPPGATWDGMVCLNEK